MMTTIGAAAQNHGYWVANTFHAGDGNIHPTPFYPPGTLETPDRLLAFWREVLAGVAARGGALSGEHGIGVEKVALMSEFFDHATLDRMRRIRSCFDARGLLNPGKVLPPLVAASSGNAAVKGAPSPSIDVNVIDGYVRVPGDVPLAEARALLRETPCELAVDPIGETHTMTVAEAMLWGRPGIRERRLGPMRDVLLGGRLRTPTGESAPFGSRFAKDVAGYDVRKLVFGSRGAFGTLDEVILKLTPRVASIVTALSLPLLAWALGEPWPVIAFGGAAAATVVALHRQNIRRLFAGTESRAMPWRQRLRGATARAEPSSGQSP